LSKIDLLNLTLTVTIVNIQKSKTIMPFVMLFLVQQKKVSH